MPKASQEKGDAQGEQQIGENGADERRSHHIKVTCPQPHQRDDELRRVSESGVEQATDGIAGARGELFR
jgi:hypothetical protein